MSPVTAKDTFSGTSLDFEAILNRIQERYPSVTKYVYPNGSTFLDVSPNDWDDVSLFLREEPSLRMEQLACLSGVDPLKLGSPDQLWVVYHLSSVTHRHSMDVRVCVAKEHPQVPSVANLWGIANFFEREAFDLFGIRFDGHPDLRRILMPSDWIGHPMRKDYVYPEAYGGVELKREGQTFESGPYK